MLLRNRIRFPLMKKRQQKMAPKSVKRPRSNSCKQLPYEIQEIICNLLLNQDESNSFALTGMRASITLNLFIANTVHRHFQFKNYLQFIGFVNTISSEKTIIPYGLYVREIDLTPVNKYGIDMRMKKLIIHCPNLVKIKFGESTSVKADTLQLMGRYCHNVHTLEIGGMISFPFMFDCDFSGMTELQSLSLLTTPLQATSLDTIPFSIRHFCIAHMDAIRHEEFATFLKRHPQLISLSIRRCRYLNVDFAALLLSLTQLQKLELTGPDINDASMKGLFDVPMQLDTLRLCNTKITNKTLEALVRGRLVVQHLELDQNVHLSRSIIDILKKSQSMETTLDQKSNPHLEYAMLIIYSPPLKKQQIFADIPSMITERSAVFEERSLDTIKVASLSNTHLQQPSTETGIKKSQSAVSLPRYCRQVTPFHDTDDPSPTDL
ncbi:hypothetical protein CU098_004006, partial [Rhizopus stolonifer]